MEFINLAHCVYTCDYHIVLVTRYRRKVFNEGIFAHFEKELAGITEHYPLIRIKTVNHDKDHIHMFGIDSANDGRRESSRDNKTKYVS